MTEAQFKALSPDAAWAYVSNAQTQRDDALERIDKADGVLADAKAAAATELAEAKTLAATQLAEAKTKSDTELTDTKTAAEADKAAALTAKDLVITELTTAKDKAVKDLLDATTLIDALGGTDLGKQLAKEKHLADLNKQKQEAINRQIAIDKEIAELSTNPLAGINNANTV